MIKTWKDATNKGFSYSYDRGIWYFVHDTYDVYRESKIKPTLKDVNEAVETIRVKITNKYQQDKAKYDKFIKPHEGLIDEYTESNNEHRWFIKEFGEKK